MAASTSSPFRRQQILHPPLPPLARQDDDSSRLYAFGGGGFGNVNVNPPIENKRDLLRRIQLIVTSTAKQFTSGFMSGYFLGSVWSLIRGPSLTVADRGIACGLDFGILSALFSGTNTVTDFILALPTKKDEKKSDSDGNSLNRQQKASLWSVVIRNVILAIYAGRNRGIVNMARLSVLYGGLTYYFVGKKTKRDAERMSMFGGNVNGVMGGGGQPSPDAMQQLLQQMMAMQGQTPPSAKVGTPPSSPEQAASSPGPSSAKSASPSASSRDKKKSIKDNAVDVEFEKADTDEDGDAN